MTTSRRILAAWAGLVVAFLGTVCITRAEAIELRLPTGRITAGREAEIPVMLDKVDNLAGAKLVIVYDKEALRFLDLTKGEKAAGLMHVVNDKEPGRLIVVMAGAKGINGEQFPLFTLKFTVAEGCPGPDAEIRITEAQLMSDTLQDLPHDLVAGRYSCQGSADGEAAAGSGGK